MGNSDNQEGGETQQDDIPRDTQLNNQYIESPLSHDNQQTTTQVNQVNQINQINQDNQINQTDQQYILLQQQGEQEGQYIINQDGAQYQAQQGEQLINQVNQQQYEENPQNVEYQINQENQEYEGGQEYEEEMEANQEYEEEMEANQEYEEEMEANQENEQEAQENMEIQDNMKGQENIEGQELQENEEIVEGGEQMGLDKNKYQIDQQGNNQVNQQSRSYKINKDGNTYQVNEKSQQYHMTSGDNRYQVKKEYKMTKIEKTNENSPKYPNNNLSPGEVNVEKSSMRKNIRINPKDSLSKVYIQSSGYYDNSPQGRYTHYSSDIPRYMSFQRSNLKSSAKIRSTVNVVKTENTSELIEIPRSEYESYVGRETVFIGGGMDTGEYKFRGQGIIITQTEAPEKIIISEEEILKEINRRKNKPKKEKKRRYEILDRFYAITEFDGKPIKKIEKVEQQNKQYEYEEQQKYYMNSKGNVGYQFSSKESQSQQIQANNQTQSQQTQQYQFQQSQFQQSSQSQMQSQSQSQSQNLQMQLNYSQNRQDNQDKNIINNLNMNINNNNMKFKNLSLYSAPSDTFSQNLFEKINNLRTNPQSYIANIEQAKKNIVKDKQGKFIYNGSIKIGLMSGENAFNNAINILKNTKPMRKLEYNPYLTVELPKTENEIKYKNDLRLKVENMINNGISIKSFWRDLIKDPEISFLMMLIDDNGDNSGMRRKDLLDPNMKYIGISSIEINGNFVCYITLSAIE